MNTLLLLMSPLLIGNEPGVWPGFLGVGASPIDAKTIALTWSAKDNVAWKAQLTGRGQSSPIIWRDRVFVTSIDGPMKDTCHVTALGLDNGRVLWTHSLESSQKTRSGYFQARSAATPVADADRVYVFFETGDVVALTHEGKVVWRRSLTKEYGEFETNIGLAASPFLSEDGLVLLIDHEGPSYLLTLDKSTGKNLWKTDRDSRHSYSSPALVPIGKANHIVCSSMGSVDGYDPKSGKKLWSFENVGGNNAATPLPYANGRFLVGAGPGMHNEREKEARKSNLAMSVELTKDGYQPKVLWQTSEVMPTFNSPVVLQGHAYWVNKVGVVYCFDAQKGKLCYAERVKQMCWTTPVGIGDRVYLFGKDGLTTVLATGPEFRILAENALWDVDLTVKPAPKAAPAPEKEGEGKKEPDSKSPSKKGGAPATRDGRNFADPVQYGVAIVNGSLVIRSGEVVYCIRQAR